jgi:hypothetical protein
MDSLLASIRDTPRSYLPWASVSAFLHFLHGYTARCEMEGRPHDWGFNRREFQQWLCDRFQLEGAAAIADTTIVSSYSLDDADAFRNYFAFLEEFLSLGRGGSQPVVAKAEKKDVIQIIRAIREQPALYLGHATFCGCCAYLIGDERANRDLGLPDDEGRVLFRNCQKWVETSKNRAGLSRPWFKVIEFYSMGIDCGHTKSGAFAIFFRWIDEYLASVKKDGLLSVSREAW